MLHPNSPPCLKFTTLDLDYFYDRIEKNDYFSYLKLGHGIWDMVLRCDDTSQNMVHDDSYRSIVAQKMNKHIINARFDIEPIYWKYLLDTFANRPSSNDFLFAVSDTAYPVRMTRKSKQVFMKRHTSIKKWLLHKKLFDGEVWRRSAYECNLSNFLKKISDKKITIVGPFYFHDFAKRLGLKNYSFVEVDLWHASKKINDTYEHIKSTHQSGTIYFIVLGGLATWLLGNLHDNLENKFLFDVGRAFDAFYLEMKNRMQWLWLTRSSSKKITQMSMCYKNVQKDN